MTAVDGVLDRLEGVVVRARARADRSGFFAAHYWHFTRAVARGLQDELFEHGACVRGLLPELANRYFRAHETWASGAAPPAPWHVPFRAGLRGNLTIAQHLLAATNAHLNVDLPIAYAVATPGRALDPHRDDFRRLRAIAAGVLEGLERDRHVVRRGAAPVNALLRPWERRMLEGVFDLERERAWTFARELLWGGPDRWRGLTSSREVAVAALGRRLLRPPWPLRAGVRLRALTQVPDPGRVIDTFYLGVDGEVLIRAALAEARRLEPSRPRPRTVPGLATLGTGPAPSTDA